MQVHQQRRGAALERRSHTCLWVQWDASGAIRVNPLPGSAAHSRRGSAGTEPSPPLLLVGKKCRGSEDLAGTGWLLSAHQLVAGVTLVLRSPLPEPLGPGGKPQHELGLHRHSGPPEPCSAIGSQGHGQSRALRTQKPLSKPLLHHPLVEEDTSSKSALVFPPVGLRQRLFSWAEVMERGGRGS